MAIEAVIAVRIADDSYFGIAIEVMKAGLAGFVALFFMILTPVLILLSQAVMNKRGGIV